MSFSDIGTEWYAKPTSDLVGRRDFLRGARPECQPVGEACSDSDGVPPWLLCALTGEGLHASKGPVVADAHGVLMSKEALIIALLAHRLPEPLRHIRSLRQVRAVHLRRSPGALPTCPVTGDDLRSEHALLRGCGCIVATSTEGLVRRTHDGTDAAGAECEACGGEVGVAVALGGPSRRRPGQEVGALVAAGGSNAARPRSRSRERPRPSQLDRQQASGSVRAREPSHRPGRGK
mmetsp:Transcript_55568/g.140858  ORF Transcript_55568/g.140858 Transcript_55568/m.140858 type:complete len:234 (-) Transcript_55568:32-733(-)